jgi:hypothetical protein
MAGMAELITWLRGWYDEERIARKALGEGPRRVDPPLIASDAHTAAWPPERVLVDLALKQLRLPVEPEHALPGGSCASCLNESWPCLTVRLLALPYADQPGYRQEWRR